ncbi:MAG: L-histidine N(alpha)-methyltransferase [Alphaproteobacteria bacterium]|nr:L-histidine N(alpha)-methyltransferase [Alphaproteobacteria bacterium]
MERWVYMDLKRGGELHSGSELWNAFVTAGMEGRNNYSLPRQEASLIQSANTIKTLSDLFGKCSVITDFGSGGAFAVKEKAMPIVKGLPNIKIYSPLDLSKMMLFDQAAKAANDDLKGFSREISVQPYHADFSTMRMQDSGDPIRLPGNQSCRRLGLFFGSTVTNQEMDIGAEFPRGEIVAEIAKLGDILNNGSRTGPLQAQHGLVIGYDSNLDPQSASTIYDDVGDVKIWAPLITGVMFDIKNVLDPQPFKKNNGGFDPQGWHHEKVVEQGPPLYPEKPDGPPQFIVVHQCVVADKDQDFKLVSEHGEIRRFDIKEGQKFVIKNNFKFHPDFLRQLTREARFNPLNPIRQEGNSMILQPLEVSH